VSNVFDRAIQNEQLRLAAERLSPGAAVGLSGVWGSAGPLAAAALGELTGRCVLLVARSDDEAEEIANDLELFSGKSARQLPPWEMDLAADHVSDEVAGERISLCGALAAGGEEAPAFVVAPIMALLQPVPTPEALTSGRTTLARGQEHGVEALAAWLVDAGYEHVEQVDAAGEFAHRGGIVDVFPPGGATAVRVEFFGDEIDSIRRFDLDTNRSTQQLEAVDIASLAAGRECDPALTTHFLSYLPAGAIICIPEPGEIAQLAEDIIRRCDDLPVRRAGLADKPERTPLPSHTLMPADELFAAMDAFARVEMFSFRPQGIADVIDLGVRSLERLATGSAEALDRLAKLAEGNELWVYCENAAEQERFGELLADSHERLAGRTNTAIGHVRAGFHWPGERLVVVGHHEIFHRYARRRRVRRMRAGRPIKSLMDLQRTDYVVHVSHGIAKFEGLRTLERDGRSEEYLSLRFADNAVLHVPATQIDLVQKYVGSRGIRPTLSRLGGKLWTRQKDRVSEAVKDMAAEMIRTQAMRRAMEGMSYPAESAMQRQFVEEFLYTETEDQLAAMGDIDADMAVPRPMDRLLCGDVGFGKTELAMRAAFKVVEGGKQAAVLVPTTVLADQHYRTFTERLADYPVEVEMISRFRTASEQAAICKRAAEGRIDVLIGTHRLLSDDVRFKDLALVVIDEEQRFGVEHKEKLKTMRATVDVLTMTATPIPRTLHMALLGLRDISSLATPPLDRRAIHTEVCQYDRKLIRMAIHRELNRRGQVFFLHNRVLDIESVADEIRRLVGDARVATAHGQMPEGRLEETMLKFVRREIDVLVCTTIIESGLDIPTANTMIIQEADRFGLSELHQLRGRVGPYRHRAYCYLLLPQRRTVSPVAAKRLKAIEEFSDLGAGFQIAMRDLEIRGAGNILGREQSGHIAAVGYELYCQLLEQAVRRLQGKDPLIRRDVHVELGIDAYIPRGYVAGNRQRMELYRRMAMCADVSELGQLRVDMTDAYGQVPPEASTLLDVAEVRARAGAAGIDSIIRHDPDIIFTVRDMKLAEGVFEGPLGTVRLPDDHTVHWRLPPACLEMPTMLTVLLKRLRQASEQV